MRHFAVTISNECGTFKVRTVIAALNPQNASKKAMEKLGRRDPRLGELRVVSVHERGAV